MSRRFLSIRAFQLLERLYEAEREERYEDAEIVCDGRECWIGLEKTSRQIVYQLLRLCVIGDVSDGGTERYTLNEEGRKVVNDPTYVPIICKTLGRR